MTAAVIAGFLVLGVAVAFVATAARRNRQPPDDIASFRRQIDALSPEARRETTARMKPPAGSATDDDGGNGT